MGPFDFFPFDAQAALARALDSPSFSFHARETSLELTGTGHYLLEGQLYRHEARKSDDAPREGTG